MRTTARTLYAAPFGRKGRHETDPARYDADRDGLLPRYCFRVDGAPRARVLLPREAVA